MLLSYLFGFFCLLCGLTEAAEKVYEPNPPVTHRVLMSIEYTEKDAKEPKLHDITIELYGTVVPKTVENFYKISQGVRALIRGQDEKNQFALSYRDTLFHRIVPNFVIQGGDVLPDVGPFSIYGAKFDDENFDLKHDRPGRLSMANTGEDTNASQFFITMTEEPLSQLDGKHVVFGQVVAGLEELMSKVQYVDTNASEKPIHDVKIKYTTVEQLRLANQEELHNKYLAQLKKFKDGDETAGVTMKQTFKVGEEEEAVMEDILYAQLHHPFAKVLWGVGLLCIVYVVAKNRNRIFRKTSQVISVRHD
ncbi:LAFE_0C01442g1_1 [Lachancea fermentati]|uniref:peptidylprolyl isomerase n=1 Tax=Lachancea fermentati TaxID=4955 RepID=A0A1G4M9C5_LACFM|nr:LAFE_0C01442g1_1 [Lachancea fermentati]